MLATLNLHKLGEFIPSSLNARIAVGSVAAIGCYLLARKTWSTSLLSSKGKTVIITGCDSAVGFGNATARRLRQLGYAVFAGCHDAKKAQDNGIYADLAKDPLFHILQIDVTNQGQVAKAVEDVDNWLKTRPDFRLFGIINNAGVGTFSPLEWLQMDTFVKIFDVNCIGAVRICKAFLPLVRRAGKDGRVVVMASIAGELATPCSMPYCASKAAAIAIVECLNIEVSQFGIKVSTICPDFYRTNMITNVAKNVAMLEREVAALTPEMLDVYGGIVRVERMKQTLNELPKIAKPDLTPVVNCMVDAIANPSPKKRYYPIDGINRFAKFLYYFAPSVLDAMMLRLIDT